MNATDSFDLVEGPSPDELASALITNAEGGADSRTVFFRIVNNDLIPKQNRVHGYLITVVVVSVARYEGGLLSVLGRTKFGVENGLSQTIHIEYSLSSRAGWLKRLGNQILERPSNSM